MNQLIIANYEPIMLNQLSTISTNKIGIMNQSLSAINTNNLFPGIAGFCVWSPIVTPVAGT